MKPKVSVLMPVYNTGDFLKDAVESILSQTYPDFEFIIINDGSTDNSQQVLESYNDPRIRIIKNEQNLGIIASRNMGIQLAQGGYIANMDSDDISMPSRLEKQVKFLEQHPEVGAVATRVLLINENNKETGIWPEDYHCITKQQIKQTLPIINCIGQPSVMMRTSVVKKIGYKNFIHNEDWGLWLDLLAEGEQIDKLDEFLLKYRVHSSSTTVTSNTKGVEKKIIRFKFSYLKNKIADRTLKGTDYNVLRSFFKDVLKFSLKTIIPGYNLLVKLYRIKIFKLLK